MMAAVVLLSAPLVLAQQGDSSPSAEVADESTEWVKRRIG